MRTIRQIKHGRLIVMVLALWVGVLPLFAAFSHACGCETERACACCQMETEVNKQAHSSCCSAGTTAEQATHACCVDETVTTENASKRPLASNHPDKNCGDCHFCGNIVQLPDLNRTDQAKIVYPQGEVLLPEWTLDFSLQTQPYSIHFCENANHSPPISNLSPRAPPFCLLMHI